METTTPADHGRRRLVTALIPPSLVVAVIWIVFAFDRVFGLDLYRYGVLPRQVKGLWGILISPFVHGNMEHLISNSAPILVLGWLLVYFYPRAAWRVVLACWAMGGLWVWTTARDSYHIGASGIIYGLAAFLFFSGVFRRRVALMAVSLIVVFLYGGMVWGVLPLRVEVSWESHLFGAIAGALMAWFYRKVPPAHVPPPIVLEDEPEEQESAALFNGDTGDEESGPSPQAKLDKDADPIRFGGSTDHDRLLD
jgi:membrane associated rhomboid family serine protease